MLLRMGPNDVSWNLPALSLDITTSAIKLSTSIYSFAWQSPRRSYTNARIDLYSTLHIADKTYFEEISNRMEEYDIILYELITDSSNCALYNSSDYKRYLAKEIASPAAENLSERFQLDVQLNMYNSIIPPTTSTLNISNMHKWFIADLDSKTVKYLESSRRADTITSFYNSRLAGRAWREQLLKKFFFPDKAIVTTLRILSWLGPCPELSCLLLDWSRFSKPTRAGGLPEVLVPIIQHLIRFEMAAATKLAFAQQLIAGLPDAGEWGGLALSDTFVRVHTRNIECCRVLKRVLEEFENNTIESIQANQSAAKNLKIAVLYGAYHVDDLRGKFRSMGLQAASELSFPDSLKTKSHRSRLTAWTMPQPFSKAVVASFDSDSSSGESVAILNRYNDLLTTVFAVIACSVYLILGALDWVLLFDFIVDATRHIIDKHTLPSSHTALVTTMLQTAFSLGDENGFLSNSDVTFEVSAAVIYTLAYIQRHAASLNAVSAVGIRWDRALFADVTTA